MADTDIVLGIGFDTSNVKKTAQEIQKEFDGVFNRSDSSGATSSALSGIEAQIDRLTQKVEELSEALKNAINVDTAEANESRDALRGTVAELVDTLHQLAEAPPPSPIDAEATEEQVDVVEEEVADMTQNIKQGISNTQGFVIGLVSGFISGFVTSAIRWISRLIHKAIQKFKQEWANAFKAIQKSFQTVLSMAGKLVKTLTKGFAGLTLKSVQSMFSLMKGLVDKLLSLKSIVVENLKLMAKWRNGNNAVNKSLSNLTSSLAYLKASLATVVAPVLNYIEPVLTRIMNQLAELITLIGMFIAKLTGATSFQKAIRVQKDYAKALKGTNNELAAFDELNVLGSKNGEAVDFAEMGLEDVDFPEWMKNIEALKKKLFELGQLIGTKLRDWLNVIPWAKIQRGAKDAAEAISAFFSGLVSVNKLGASIGKAIAELVRTFTTFFNTFMTTMPWGSIGKQLGEMFKAFIETVPWDELGQMFSNAWNSLFEVLFNFLTSFNGTELGQGLTTFIQNSIGRIDWTLIRATLYEAVHRIVEMLIEFITPENFALVGTTLAEVLNTVFSTIGTFVSDMSKKGGSGKTGWSQFGESIATGIVEAFKNFDAKQAGEAVGSLAMGLLDILLSAIDYMLEHIDEITDKIVEFLVSIPWEDLGGKISEISDKLFEAFEKIWTELEQSGALDDIIEIIARVLSEKSSWEKVFKQVRFQVMWEAFWAQLKASFTVNTKNFLDTEQLQKFKDIGLDIIFGICGGMILPDAFNKIREVVLTIFRSITGAFVGADAFDIHSPSKAMEPIGENIILGILEGFKLVNFIQAVREWWNSNVVPWFTEIYENLDIFKEVIALKSDAVKKKIIDTFTAIKEGIKAPINGIIALVEGLVNKVIDGLNWLIDRLGKMNFTVPDWVPEWGGNSFELNLSKLSHVEIPRLAQGSVVPPNREFMAMLGDNKKETEVVSPLSTMQEAMISALQAMGFDGGQPINIYLGTEKIYSEIRKLEKRNVVMGG